MTNTKEYGNFHCVFSHNAKSKILAIDYFKKGRLCYRACVQNIKKPFAKKFINMYDEKMAKEVYNYNIEII
jgi:hypothetical protein